MLLRIQLESIQEFIVRNPEITPEMFGEKFCRLDINMIVNGQRIDLEVQVANEGDYPERVMYYWAREFSSSLAAGQSYSALPRTIVISIIDFTLFDCAEFHSFFQPLETTRHTLLSDKMGFYFFELKKLPDDINEKDPLLLWLSLFKANTEEELKKIRAMEVPEMEQAINAYYTITASPEFREIERLRDKARHDEAQALYHAEQKGIAKGKQEGMQAKQTEIALNALQMGMSITDIAKLTGLTSERIECLREDIRLITRD